MTSETILLYFAYLFLICCFLEMEINPPISACSGGENGWNSPTATGVKETHNRKVVRKVCFLEMEINPPISACSGGENGWISPTATGVKETHNRKLLSRDSERYGVVVGDARGKKKSESESESEWEREMVRWVPSGPDPLHHNGANPKKPRSP